MKLIYPFDTNYSVTSNYAAHLADPTRKGFPGVDYAVSYGHPIIAVAPGSYDVYTASAKLGNDAVLIHQMGSDQWRWDFCHCSKLFSEPYKAHNVAQGTQIGLSGNTGYVLPAPTKESPYSGTHVHVSLRINGAFVDPEPVIDNIKAGNITIPGTEVVPVDTAALEAKQRESLAKIDQLDSEITAKDIQIVTLQKEKEDLSTQLAVQTEIATKENQIDFNLINTQVMAQTVDLSSKLGNAGKYLAVASPIAVALTAALEPVFKANNYTDVAVGAITVGLSVTINLIMIAINHKWDIF